MPGQESSRCVAGVPESPVWGSGGRCVRPRLWLLPWLCVMRAAGRGGSEDGVEEVDEAEDEEKVTNAGGAVMRAAAGLWAAASAAATARRMEAMSSGCRLGAGGWGGLVVTWRPGAPIWSAAAGEGGAGLWPSPSGLGWLGVLQCVRLRGLASAGGNNSRGLHSGAGGGGPGSSRVCAGGVCGPLGGVGVCGLSSVGGGEGCPAGGSVAGVCWCSGGWGRPVLRGPGLRAMVGVCGSPREQREGRGMGGVCAVECAVSVYVSARSGALAWSVVGRAVWRRSLPSSAAAARISQTSLRIWWTSWSVVRRGYASSGLRPTRLRTLWMAWYPQVRECCGLGVGVWPRVQARLDLCVGGGDGPNPGHGPRGWPAALDPVGQAEHGQSQVVARLP